MEGQKGTGSESLRSWRKARCKGQGGTIQGWKGGTAGHRPPEHGVRLWACGAWKSFKQTWSGLRFGKISHCHVQDGEEGPAGQLSRSQENLTDEGSTRVVG